MHERTGVQYFEEKNYRGHVIKDDRNKKKHERTGIQYFEEKNYRGHVINEDRNKKHERTGIQYFEEKNYRRTCKRTEIKNMVGQEFNILKKKL